jgi:hypothetical protein
MIVVALMSSVGNAQNQAWQAYSPSDSSFRVELPAPLSKVMSYYSVQGANLDPKEKWNGCSVYAAIETTPEESRFGMIVYNGIKVDSTFCKSREDCLELLIWTSIIGPLAILFVTDDAKVRVMINPVAITQNGLTGKEYSCVAKDSTENKSLFTKGRIFDTGAKVYQIIFVGQSVEDLTSPDAERFLNSFRLRKQQ